MLAPLGGDMGMFGVHWNLKCDLSRDVGPCQNSEALGHISAGQEGLLSSISFTGGVTEQARVVVSPGWVHLANVDLGRYKH